MRELVWLVFSGFFAPHASFDGVHVESIWRSTCLRRFVWKRPCSLVSFSAFAKTISAVFSQWAASTLLHWNLWVATCARKIQCGDVNAQHFDSYVDTISVSLRLSTRCKRILDSRKSWDCIGMRSVACDASGSQTAPEPARCPNLERQPCFPEKETSSLDGWMPLVQLLLHKLDIAFRQGMEQCKSVINVASPCQNTSAFIHSEQNRPNLLTTLRTSLCIMYV